MDGFLAILSAFLGWAYVFLWSISFYPQPFLNHRRKSTAGTTVDFPLINCFGYICYLTTNLSFYYSPLIRRQYASRYHGLTPTVRFNDIVFALHALLLSLLTLSQYTAPCLWRYPSANPARPSRFILGCIAGGILGPAVIWSLVLRSSSSSTSITSSFPSILSNGGSPDMQWCELDLVYAIGYVKVVVTLVKYSPQILANRRNRSTKGWSIWQILLDVGGGVGSIAQLAIDSYLQRDWSGITGNPVKLAIGNASLFFDCVFLVQHYVLYRNAEDEDGLRERLLGDEEADGR